MADSWRERIQWVVDRFANKTGAELARQLSTYFGREVKGQTVSAWTRKDNPTTPGGAFLEAILRLHPQINPQYLLTGTGPRERTDLEGGSPYAQGVDEVTRKMIQEAVKARQNAGLTPLPGAEGVSPEKSLEILRLGEESEEGRGDRRDTGSNEGSQGRGRGRDKPGAAGSGARGSKAPRGRTAG